MRDIGAPELVIILVVVVFFFGANKLPELARGAGRAIRIFKAETSAKDGVDEQALADADKTDTQRS